MPVACQSCAPERPQAFVAAQAVTERFECNVFDNLSVICFANATSPYTGEASRCGGVLPPDRLWRSSPLFEEGGFNPYIKIALNDKFRAIDDRGTT